MVQFARALGPGVDKFPEEHPTSLWQRKLLRECFQHIWDCVYPSAQADFTILLTSLSGTTSALDRRSGTTSALNYRFGLVQPPTESFSDRKLLPKFQKAVCMTRPFLSCSDLGSFPQQSYKSLWGLMRSYYVHLSALASKPKMFADSMPDTRNFQFSIKLQLLIQEWY